MGIEASFSMAQIRAKLLTDMATIVKLQIRALTKLGEKCANHAKDIPAEIGYTDRTGALRSSTGYAVYAQGKAVVYGYSGENAEGISTGREIADSHGLGTEGIVLVVTAGENYAVHVESTGRDVLTSAEQLAISQMPRLIREIKEQMRSMK